MKIEVTAGGLSDALPALVSALGERLPDDPQPAHAVSARPVAELKLRLRNGAVAQVSEGVQRATATAQLLYDPADPLRPAVESREFKFTAPLGPIEAEDLRWYLESYYLWPTGVFNERAAHIESRLPVWGQELYKAATGAQSAQKLLADWMSVAEGSERRFSVMVENRALEGSEDEEQAVADEAASALLSLPWELLHDGDAYLFHDRNPVRVRRSLPKERPTTAAPTGLPIRILLVSPRPEDKRAAYIDHRASAKPLVEALEDLGELVSVSLLTPPTFPALQESLRRASEAGKPFHVVHFDGHGVYDRERSLGALCFEDPADEHKLSGRASELIYAAPPKDKSVGNNKYMVDLVRAYRIPLMFLEACQRAMADKDPTASVAGRLLQGGVASVVAMSHTVLVETARRFVAPFYLRADGRPEDRPGDARRPARPEGRHLPRQGLPGRAALAGLVRPGPVPGGYRPPAHHPRPGRAGRASPASAHAGLGELPVGRHTLRRPQPRALRAERLLEQAPYVVLRGEGGEGKTTLAAELARWLVATGRYRRTVRQPGENADAPGVLCCLAGQLVPNFPSERRGDYAPCNWSSPPWPIGQRCWSWTTWTGSSTGAQVRSRAAAAFEPGGARDPGPRHAAGPDRPDVFDLHEPRGDARAVREERPVTTPMRPRVGRRPGGRVLGPRRSCRTRPRAGAATRRSGTGRRRRRPRPQPRVAGRRGRRLRRPPRHAAPARADVRPPGEAPPTTASTPCWPASSCRCAASPPRAGSRRKHWQCSTAGRICTYWGRYSALSWRWSTALPCS